MRSSGHSLTSSRAESGALGIHPHVERSVVGVGEAALPGVELHRGDAQVHVDDVRDDALALELGQRVGEVGANEARRSRPARASISANRSAAVGSRSMQISVPGRAEALGDQPGVTAAAERAVDGELARLRVR